MLHLLGSFEAPGSFCDKLSGRLESLVSQDAVIQLASLVQVLGLRNVFHLDLVLDQCYSTPSCLVMTS